MTKESNNKKRKSKIYVKVKRKARHPEKNQVSTFKMSTFLFVERLNLFKKCVVENKVKIHILNKKKRFFKKSR